jgi:hypothetical protein
VASGKGGTGVPKDIPEDSLLISQVFLSSLGTIDHRIHANGSPYISQQVMSPVVASLFLLPPKQSFHEIS